MSAIGVNIPRGALVHGALFYRDEPGYLTGTVPFVREGIELGEPVLVAVPASNLHLLRSALGGDATHVGFVDMAASGRNPGRIIPEVFRGFADAYPDARVRMVTEPVWPGRPAREYPACAQHEALVNLAFAGRTATIVCPYDTEALDPDTLEVAAATHPVLIDEKGEHDSLSYAIEPVLRACNRPLPEPTEPPDAIGFDATNLGRARALVVERARGAGLKHERVIDVELAVSELAANTLVHGGGSGLIRVWTEDAHLVCEVRDAGHITDPLVGRRPVGPDAHGGRGVLLVNYLSDLVRLRSGPDGTTIRAYFAQ